MARDCCPADTGIEVLVIDELDETFGGDGDKVLSDSSGVD